MDFSINEIDFLFKIALSYYNWELEKEKLLFDKEENKSDKKKKYFLINKKRMNYFKEHIKYEELKKNIETEKLENSSINIEETIKKHIQNNSLEMSGFGSSFYENKYNFKMSDAINNLLKDQDFNLEIINEEVKDSLLFDEEFIFEIYRIDIKDKLVFEMYGKEFYLILLISTFEDDYISKLFFIFDFNDNNSIKDLKKVIKEKNNSEILNLFKIDLNYLKENEYKKYEYNTDLTKGKSQCKLFVNKFKYERFSLDEIKKTLVTKRKYSYESNKDKIYKFYKCFELSNERYNKALTSQEIRSNYSPCKILNKEWIENFLNLKKEENKNKKFKELVQNFKKMSQDNIEKNEFYIIDENCFISLFPLIEQLEQRKDKYLDYQIYLNEGNKGAIIIKEDIYIFQTNDDINKRYSYEKIQNENKYKYLYYMVVNPNYELTEQKWNELRNSNKKIEPYKNKLNESKRSSTFLADDDKETNILLDSLHKKEKELNKKEEDLKKKEIEFNKMEKDLKKKEIELNNKLIEINNNQKVILNKKIPTIGLQNLGATCYMNAVLQCIAHFHEVSEEILTWYKYSNDPNKKNRKLSYAFAEVLNNLYIENQNQSQNKNNDFYYYKSNNKSYAPTNFKQIVGDLNPLFRGIQANDSKDMMNFIVEKMHEELNPLRVNNIQNNNYIDQTNELATFNYFKAEFDINYHSALSDYLYGIQKSVTLCLSCNNMIFNFQTYNFLIFPLLDVKKYITMCNYQNPFFNMQNYVLNLIDCFKYFQKIDLFTGLNQIFCNKCKCLRDANYCTMLHNVPTILCIVLNRGKDNKDFLENINFGTKLDLSDFLQDKNDLGIYYLIGVVVHVGDSSMSGHFFAYCRSHFTCPWYKYNDSIVTLSNEKEIYSVGKPYILFYHKYQ